jgi:hypothetical protein
MADANDTNTKAMGLVRRTPAPIDMPGQVAADAISEFIEILIEDLGPFGLDATGLTAIKALLKKVGLDNSYVIHTVDTAFRIGLRHVLHNKPLLRETLIGVSDAYFDKLKLLPDKPNQEQMQKAKAEGQKSAFAKMREFTAKKNAKPSHEKLLEQLEPAELKEYARWMAHLQVKLPEQSKQWKSLREKIGSLKILKEVLAIMPDPNPDGTPPTDEQITSARILFLEGIYSTRPTPLEVLTTIASGESTPHTEALMERVEAVKTDRQAKAKDAADSLAKTKKRYRW